MMVTVRTETFWVLRGILYLRQFLCHIGDLAGTATRAATLRLLVMVTPLGSVPELIHD
jgi:hypothetical protein